MRVLTRGEADEPSPDAIVELDDVWLHEGPMLLQVLQDAGINARGVESTNVAVEATASNRMRIFVAQVDLPRARGLLEEHRRS